MGDQSYMPDVQSSRFPPRLGSPPNPSPPHDVFKLVSPHASAHARTAISLQYHVPQHGIINLLFQHARNTPQVRHGNDRASWCDAGAATSRVAKPALAPGGGREAGRDVVGEAPSACAGTATASRRGTALVVLLLTAAADAGRGEEELERLVYFSQKLVFSLVAVQTLVNL